MKCLICGRFCKNIVAIIQGEIGSGDEQITKVEGDCSKCGHVDLTAGDWCAEMFITEKDYQDYNNKYANL